MPTSTKFGLQSHPHEKPRPTTNGYVENTKNFLQIKDASKVPPKPRTLFEDGNIFKVNT
ncbi:hypothetical protein L207DRAFT_335348 [Hyaloscypha variabilis F]|uniref:Uncharacterized protein n=1 Tax=Hyaloscypha variabilis (strain UAMH 11265 / GT02V1 / F) TaxID=1149755 RepID=A0A2J6RNW1_HYAVF|nr:hypothetical protein L207DRAFT_335348 [Hyaloscypha variabilis F]